MVGTTGQYYEHLVSLFPEDVYGLFIQHILDKPKRAGNRNEYKEICSCIRLLAQAGGKDQARQVISHLLTTYTRKPAFKEELLKLKV